MQPHHTVLNLLFIACLFALGSQAVQYSDLENLGMESCPSRNSCPQVSSNFTERICECDSSCPFFGDCCIDAGRGRSRRHPNKICIQFGNYSYNGAYVVGDCPTSFSGPAGLRDLCRNGNISDPILSAPVTDTLSRRTYLNRYCAICNEASATSLKTWLISACKKPASLSWEDITYHEDQQSWGKIKDGQFKPCQIGYDKPASVSSGLRLCRPNLVSDCPSSWTRATYIRACESYMSVVIDSKGTLFRNPHCAICNDVRIDDLSCFNPTVDMRNNKPFSYALLLDVNRGDGDLVGMRNTCGSGRKYDPFFKKCRNLVCAIPGYTMVNGKCKKN